MDEKITGEETREELEVCSEVETEQDDVKTVETEETVENEEMVQEKTETKKKAKKEASKLEFSVSVGKLIAATVVLVLLVVVLIGALIYGITGKLPYNFGATAGPDLMVTLPNESTTPTSAPRTAEDLGMTIEGVTDRASYLGDAAALGTNAGEVIATSSKYSLTNGQLRVFYYMGFSGFVSEVTANGQDPKTTYNLDVTQPLDSQLIVNSVVTWEQFFLHNALDTFYRYAAINALADEAAFALSDEEKATIEGVPEQLEEDAKEQGYESAAAMIEDRIGTGCTVEDFVFYMEFTARGDLYADQFIANYEPTMEEVEEFYNLEIEYYTYNGITKEAGKPVSVRHVLLVPEGATTDSSTGYVTATDEQWAAGEAAAQAMLDAWVAEGATEEGFAALANEHSTDGGSNTNGGLYENVPVGMMVEAFDAWIFDESRKPGDYGIVKTEFGYHLMYLVSQSEQDYWVVMATRDCKSTGYCLSTRMEKIMAENPMEPALDKILLPDVKRVEKEETTQTTEPATTEPATTEGETTAATE